MVKVCVWMRCEGREFSAETSSSLFLLSPFVDSAEEGRNDINTRFFAEGKSKKGTFL